MLPREQILQKNNKNISQPKEFNKNTDTPKTDPSKATISQYLQKSNPVRFSDPYDHINPMDNTHDETHILDTQEQNREDGEGEQEELFEKKTQ